jgi:predicted nucleotide-binding protein
MPNKKDTIVAQAARKKPVLQTDVPAYALDDALRVPRAIAENYASQPTRPLAVAQAMGIAPTSGGFKMLCGAAIAYGLTEGGYNAAHISVTPLAKRIIAPTAEGDDLIARRESLLNPRIIGEFLRKYDGSKVPRDEIAQNVLVEMSVPKDATPRVLNLVLEGARAVGFLREINGASYIDIGGIAVGGATEKPIAESQAAIPIDEKQAKVDSSEQKLEPPSPLHIDRPKENRRVFITHGKNKSIVPHLKALLEYGQFEPVVSVDRESVSKPVPDKVMDDMRACGAAIIHVDAEEELITPEGEKIIVLNPNVLIEIGAAMALYGRKFILLVKEGVRLPSNLQGLYEVRYVGDQLDGDSTLKLLKAFNDFKNYQPKQQ